MQNNKVSRAFRWTRDNSVWVIICLLIILIVLHVHKLEKEIVTGEMAERAAKICEEVLELCAKENVPISSSGIFWSVEQGQILISVTSKTSQNDRSKLRSICHKLSERNNAKVHVSFK